MYLKEIVTSGFKSFADKLNIKLDDKITCIVGPNGSGKSNIVDAVRWVLGEQSVKSLRGDGAMTDVIFSGSKSRNPLNVASVELIFDNSDHYLNISYNEISIKRKVYRSGENEYFLNNEKCRLKDITNLFMDSGVGRESFNIISQGEVQKILSHSSYDRRLIFEEAAGILKYKKRKEEALRKLDRTHNNIDRVDDIIAELEVQVNPLKEQSEKAKEYLENKKGLEKYEVALLAYDIENNSLKIENIKEEKQKLEEEIVSLQVDTSRTDSKSIEDKNTLEKLEKELSLQTNLLIQITEEVEKLNSERMLLKERSNNVDEDTTRKKIRNLLEKKGQIETSLVVAKEDFHSLEENLHKKAEESKDLQEQLEKLNQKKNLYNQDYLKINRDNSVLEQKMKALQMELDAGGNIPNSVRSILKASTLEGIYNTIGNILSIDSQYEKALDVAIQSSRHFIITKDEQSSIQAISYLKEKKLGRATFFPLTVIKGRSIDDKILQRINNDDDFIGVLSNLIKYDKKYQNIVENQLGTTLVSKNITSANRLSGKINARYRIVTLEGDVVHVGGSMSGGSHNQANSAISLKHQLEQAKWQLEKNMQQLKNIEDSMESDMIKIHNYEEMIFDISKECMLLEEKHEKKKNEIQKLEEKQEFNKQEYDSYQTLINHSFDEKEQELIKKYHDKKTQKELMNSDINNLTQKIADLKIKIEEDNASLKLHNSRLREIEKAVQEKNVLLNRLDLELDHMLLVLNEEYSLTYEHAKETYHLDIEVEIAREKVDIYKKNIKRIGMVNLLAIEEYERISTRYEFLLKQKNDLQHAEETLLEIMNEMDDVMKEEFLSTFQAIEVEFKQVFKELFKGGEANLKLTNPSDLLTTGIEIVASPPGKKLTTISLLSGGEKTLTAISLLFAILNVRTVPFCLLDEVEAALDEANVSEFGKYLNHYKNKTQFLIITHKQKTMEYADTLYGITMQESGVSKLVSVKLNERAEII